MASPSDTPSTANPASTSPPTTAHGAPVEMASLPPPTGTEPVAATPTPAHTTETPAIASSDTAAPAQPALPQEIVQSTEPTTAAANPTPPTNLNRTETEAIGPSTDTPAANPDSSNGPVVVIMLLLTTGARHPYKIDEKYLKKRSVTVEDMDPYNISVYTLKELIWRDWREGECVRWLAAVQSTTCSLATVVLGLYLRRHGKANSSNRVGTTTDFAEFNTPDTFWSHVRRQGAVKRSVPSPPPTCRTVVCCAESLVWQDANPSQSVVSRPRPLTSFT